MGFGGLGFGGWGLGFVFILLTEGQLVVLHQYKRAEEVGSECRVYGLWFRVYGLWFMVYGLWFMVYGLWFMV